MNSRLRALQSIRKICFVGACYLGARFAWWLF